MRPGIYTFLIFLFSFLVFDQCTDQKDCDCNLPANLRPMSAQEEEVAASANNFAFDLFSKINEANPTDNFFISPFSVSAALAMTANGGVGTTEEAIKKAIHLEGMSDDEMNEAYKTLVEFLLQVDPKVTIEIANSSWYKQQLTVKETFRNILNNYYDAEVLPADFSDPNTVDLINNWIADKTHDKIKNMLDAIPDAAVMYLINAIYFKAEWRYRFDENETKPRPFYLANGSEIQTPTMYGEKIAVTRYRADKFQLVSLPYGNGQYNMSIVLPNQGESLNDVIGNLNQQQFDDYLSNADSITTGIYLPKFKMEFKTLLNDVLSDMGMGIAFSDNADFSNLFDQSLALKISRVLHQTFLEVNEKETEAAAATIVEIVVTSAGPDHSFIEFNRPFAFFISEKHSNAILFAGKLFNPGSLSQ